MTDNLSINYNNTQNQLPTTTMITQPQTIPQQEPMIQTNFTSTVPEPGLDESNYVNIMRQILELQSLNKQPFTQLSASTPQTPYWDDDSTTDYSVTPSTPTLNSPFPMNRQQLLQAYFTQNPQQVLPPEQNNIIQQLQQVQQQIPTTNVQAPITNPSTELSGVITVKTTNLQREPTQNATPMDDSLDTPSDKSKIEITGLQIDNQNKPISPSDAFWNENNNNPNTNNTSLHWPTIYDAKQ